MGAGGRQQDFQIPEEITVRRDILLKMVQDSHGTLLDIPLDALKGRLEQPGQDTLVQIREDGISQPGEAGEDCIDTGGVHGTPLKG